MDWTVCVCVRDGQAWIDRCLDALVAEARDGGYKIRVIDHLSRDETPRILGEWMTRAPEILSVERFEGHGLAAARNQAWKGTQTDWVGFVDIDCRLHPGWGRAAAAAISKFAEVERVASIGGSNTVPKDGRLVYRALDVLLSSYIGGHDSIQNREFSASFEVEHTPTLNVIYRRGALEKVRGFDESFDRVAEDIDLSRRLRNAGYTLQFEPSMRLEHGLRPDWRSWVKNMFLYGRGRANFLTAHPSAFHPKFLAPTFVFLGYVCLTPFPLLLAALAAAHFGAILLILAFTAFRRNAGISGWLAGSALTWATHFAYGAGLMRQAAVLVFRRVFSSPRS